MLQDLQKFYEKEGRQKLPWRLTSDPYKILVSELMLQQTQVDRVLPKYREFLRAFPTIGSLAKAPLSQVLFHWQGLGYNRRAKFLHEAAKVVVKEYGGKLPTEPELLQKLPGIGPYTARAVAAFAFNQPVVFIETNIRTVYFHHHFLVQPEKPKTTVNAKWIDISIHSFSDNTGKSPLRKISDAELLPLIAKDLKRSKMEPRAFYWALMDYGSYLKRQGVKLNQHSKHYTKQSKFEGSLRQLRGAILKQLLLSPTTAAQLQKRSGRAMSEVEKALSQLQQEGLIFRQGPRYLVGVKF